MASLVEARLNSQWEDKKYKQSLKINDACASKNINKVREAILSGARPESDTLTEAVKSHNVDIVREVLKLQAEPNGETLTFAALTGNLQIFEMVLEAGAKLGSALIDYDNGARVYAGDLTAACKGKNKEIVTRLIELGATLSEGSQQGEWFPGECYPDIWLDTFQESLYSGDESIIKQIYAMKPKICSGSFRAACAKMDCASVQKMLSAFKPSLEDLEEGIKNAVDVDLIRFLFGKKEALYPPAPKTIITSTPFTPMRHGLNNEEKVLFEKINRLYHELKEIKSTQKIQELVNDCLSSEDQSKLYGLVYKVCVAHQTHLDDSTRDHDFGRHVFNNLSSEPGTSAHKKIPIELKYEALMEFAFEKALTSMHNVDFETQYKKGLEERAKLKRQQDRRAQEIAASDPHLNGVGQALAKLGLLK